MKNIRWDKCNVVGTVCDTASLQAASLRGSCDVVEIRADLYYPRSIARAIYDMPRPTILTVRDECEGGAERLTTEDRIQRYSSLLLEVSAFDVEIANIRLMQPVLDIAREHDIPFIASMHDFQGVPSRSAITRAVARARDAGAACIKIAALTDTSNGLSKLVDRLDLLEGMPFALMGMGRFAFASRVLFMQCGSCLNYGSLGTATAPNQPTAKQLLQVAS